MLLVPSAVIADDLVRFALSLDAHQCCARTGGECAQLRTPDQCCRTQQEAASQGYASTAPDSRPRLIPQQVALALPPSVFAGDLEPPAVARDDSASVFKRPHDPPYLHPFPLLI